MSVLEFTPSALAAVAPHVEALARAEGLEGHWQAVAVRVEKAAPARRSARRTKPARPRFSITYIIIAVLGLMLLHDVWQRVQTVAPLPYSEVEAVLAAELRQPIPEIFTQIDPEPLGSASIGQVHRARLRTGQDVVIKVQRPGIIARCMADMKIMRFMAKLVAKFKKNAELANPVGVVDDFT